MNNSKGQLPHIRFHLRYHFTLIELLVVIAIISILASLLLPALKKARNRGDMVVCLNNTRQITSGIISYTNDYDGYVPYVKSWYPTFRPVDCAGVSKWLSYGTSTLYYPLAFLIEAKYAENPKVFECPSRLNRKGASHCLDTSNYKQKVDGANIIVYSSYCIKYIRYEEWLINAGSSTYNFAYRPDNNNRILLFEDPSYCNAGVYVHTKPWGMTVSYEDGSCEFIITKKLLPSAGGSSDIFNNTPYYLRKDGGPYRN